MPGRLERRGEEPLEIWDGAHNIAGVGYLLPRLPARPFTLVVSILGDKDVDAMLARARGRRRHARRHRVVERARARLRRSSPRSRRPHFARVEAVADPRGRRSSGRATLAGADGAVLVTGSLYLLADLSDG